MQNIKIDKCSIILTYSFLYDECVVKKAAEDKKIKNLPKVENLLNYVDKLFEKNRAITLLDTKKNIYLYAGIIYELKLEKAEIYFFDNNIAFLYLKLTPLTEDLQSLYHINKALTTFYTKKSDDYIYLGVKDPSSLNLEKKEFLEIVNAIKVNTKEDKILKDKKNEILEEFHKEHELFNEYYSDNYISLKEIENERLLVEISMENEFTKAFYKIYIAKNKKYELYSPHEKNDDSFDENQEEIFKDRASYCKNIFTRAFYKIFIAKNNESCYPHETPHYPFDKSREKTFKDRVGYCKKEFKNINQQNEEFTQENIGNRHYLYFENQQKLAEDTEKFDFIHCDTFISSMVMKYLKKNDGTLYYDNFNPIATNYVNSYITLICDAEIINDEYKKNFVSFEPLISSKTNKGSKITQSDFFHIYQSQADIFTLGNSRNILHILDKKAKLMKSNKEHDHLFVYLLTSVQKIFLLNIINSSIVQNQKLNTIKIYSWLSKAKDNYNRFLTNYNFKVISNNSSVDSSYHFFRKCNRVDELSSQWNDVSFTFDDSKSILGHIIKLHPVLTIFITIIVSIPFLWQLISKYYEMLAKILNFF